MNKIVFIRNINHYLSVKSNCPDLLNTHIVITSFFPVYLELKEKGMEVHSLSEFLNREEFFRILKDERVLAREWYKGFEHLLDYKGINLGELARIDHVNFFRDTLASNFIINRIISEQRPEEIALFSDMDVPCIGRSRHDGTNSVFEAVVLHQAELKGVAVRKLFLKKKALILSFAGKSFEEHIDKFVERACINLYLAKKRLLPEKYDSRRLPVESFQKCADKKLVVGFGVTYDLLMLWQFVKTLSGNGKFQGILINTETSLDAHTFRSGIEGDMASFIALEDFKSSGKSSEIRRNLCRAREIFKKEKFERLPEMNVLNNPYLNVQFDYIWNSYFGESISMIDRISVFFEKVKPDIVVIADIMSYPSRILVKLARAYGVKSVSVPHGWVGDIGEYEYESDLYLAWGDLGKKQLLKEFNKASKSVEVIGALHFEGIIEEFSNIGNSGKYKQKLGFKPDRPLVVLLTSGFSSTTISPLIFKELLKLWDTIIEFASSHKDVEFVIKPHPAHDNVEWYKKLMLESKLSNIKVIEGVKLESVVPAMDVALLVGTVGTSGYITLLGQKPLIYLNNVANFNIPTIDAWAGEEGITSVTDIDDLSAVLEKVLYDKSFRNECIEKGQNFLKQSLRLGDAKERFLRVVSSL